MFNKIIIFGLGLIGGSIAKDIKKNKITNNILAYDISQSNIKYAIDSHIIDSYYDFNDKITENDLVIIAAPLSSYGYILDKISNLIDGNPLIIDVGSVKSFVKNNLLKKYNAKIRNNFIPCHPIAGLEKSSVQNSISGLFLEKKVIITKNNDKIIDFWKNIGSKVEIMNDSDHDDIFALTSHLPQLISFYLKSTNINYNSDNVLLQKHSRLQNSNVLIWSDIFNFNKSFINKYLKEYRQNLFLFKDYFIHNNYSEILNLLENSIQITDKGNFDNITNYNYKKDDELLIICSILIASSLILIDDLKYIADYCGSGFKDFTIILFYLKYFLDSKELLDILQKNKENIINFLTKLENIKL